MDAVIRGEYTFIGPKADKAAEYYDIVISHGYKGDVLYLVWDSAHKFGQRVLGPNIASYRDGIVHGEKALEAAVYIDKKRDEVFAALPEYNRKKALQEEMKKHFSFAEKEYSVTFQRM